MGQHDIINDYIAGALGGAAGLIVGHPFDTTKVQLQTNQTSTPYKGTWDAFKNVQRSGMVRGFFRGLGFPLVSYGVVNSVFFGAYGNTLSYLKGENKIRRPTHSEAFLAGCVGGFVQLFVACPVDVVKVVLQSQIRRSGGVNNSKTYFHGPKDLLQKLYHTGGLRTCYRGFWIMMLRDIPASGTCWLINEGLYDWFINNGLTDRRGVIANILAGGTAGVISWMLVVPFDVIKSEMQADYSGHRYKSSLQATRAVYASSGLRGFWTGMLMISIRAFPVNAVIFLVYRLSLEELSKVW